MIRPPACKLQPGLPCSMPTSHKLDGSGDTVGAYANQMVLQKLGRRLQLWHNCNHPRGSPTLTLGRHVKLGRYHGVSGGFFSHHALRPSVSHMPPCEARSCGLRSCRCRSDRWMPERHRMLDAPQCRSSSTPREASSCDPSCG